MKSCILLLTLCLSLLTACTNGVREEPGSLSDGASIADEHQASDAVLSLDPDEVPAYAACRIIDGAEDGGPLLLAELDYALDDGHDSAHNGKNVYRLSLTEDIAVTLDGAPASAADLRDGMPVEVAFNGSVLESFPAQLGQVYSIAGYSIGARQNPGGTTYDLCGLYLQALDDLWNRESALNENITLAGLDLAQAPGDLLDSEKSALAWRFGELHGVEVLEITFEELMAQGYLTETEVAEGYPPAVSWTDGCLFSIQANSGHENEVYSLPALFFDVEKWRGSLAAYCLYDCSALWPEMGTWSSYNIGSEMIS